MKTSHIIGISIGAVAIAAIAYKMGKKSANSTDSFHNAVSPPPRPLTEMSCQQKVAYWTNKYLDMKHQYQMCQSALQLCQANNP